MRREEIAAGFLNNPRNLAALELLGLSRGAAMTPHAGRPPAAGAARFISLGPVR